jgi:hypothetical protein
LWRGLYIGGLILFFNGAAELIGGLIKDIGKKIEGKKYATAFIRIGISILMIIAVAIHYTITKEF